MGAQLTEAHHSRCAASPLWPRARVRCCVRNGRGEAALEPPVVAEPVKGEQFAVFK